jgi:hypothetical protein
MSIIGNFKILVRSLIPTRERIIIRGRQEQPAVAHTLSVDALAGILRTAESGDQGPLFTLYRDILAAGSHIQSEFSKRKLAVLGQPFSLTPDDPKNPAQTAHAADLQQALGDADWWLPAMSHCLDSTLFPVALCERWYAPSDRPGWRWTIGGIRAVPHGHLVWPDGVLALRDTDADGNFTGTRTRPEATRFFTHRANLMSAVPDWFGGPMRALVFWWLFAAMDRDWWVRFLDRFGAPFLEGRYDPADERGRYELEAAFSAATRLFGIVVSNDTEVKMHQANATAADAFERFHGVANREISKLILGQTLSAEGQNLGLGGGQAAAQADVREDLRIFDAVALAQTVRTQILKPLWQLNGWTMPLPKVSWGSLGADAGEVNGQTVAALFQAGIEPTDEGLEVVAARLGYGLRRIGGTGPRPVAMAAEIGLGAMLPTVSERAARARQARVAVDALARRSAPALARILTHRAGEFEAALLASTSADDAAARFAGMAAAYDPTAAASLIADTLSSAAVSAAIAHED